MTPQPETTTTLPKIFVFINGRNALGFEGCAISEDGKCLAGHCSSSPGWTRVDMIDSGWKDERYAAHYPNGYMIVDLIDVDPDTDEGFRAAVALANAAAKSAVAEPSHV